MQGKIATPLGQLSIIIEENRLVRCKWVDTDSEKLKYISGVNTSFRIWALPNKDRISTEFGSKEVKEQSEKKIFEKLNYELKKFFHGELTKFSLPYHLKGTKFQLKVWDEISKIPYGETKTYGEIASALGSPGAARAVANACGANPLPVIIPCHRVVATGGKTGGYTGGIEKKIWMLEFEQSRLMEKTCIKK